MGPDDLHRVWTLAHFSKLLFSLRRCGSVAKLAKLIWGIGFATNRRIVSFARQTI